MRTLVIDIETRPHLGYIWALWDQNIGLSQLVEVGSVICFAAKWVGEKKVIFHSDHHDGHDAMVSAAWELLDEADALVHYNGKSFDVKHLNREFILAGKPPPAPHADIDLLTTARGRFKFPSNKLDHVADALGLGRKVQHSGFDLWTRCLAEDPKAWAEMRKYNIQDVNLTEALYHRLLPWIRTHPNVNLYDKEVRLSACPKCGGEVMARGYFRTTTATYQKYQCKSCGSYSRRPTREPDTTTKRRNVA